MMYMVCFLLWVILRMHIWRNKFKVWNLWSTSPWVFLPKGSSFWLFPKELKCQSTVPSNVTWMLQGCFLLVEKNGWICGMLRPHHLFMNRSVVRSPGGQVFFSYSKPSVFWLKKAKVRRCFDGFPCRLKKPSNFGPFHGQRGNPLRQDFPWVCRFERMQVDEIFFKVVPYPSLKLRGTA